MASRILFNSAEQIDQTISGGYIALVLRGTGLVRNTGIQDISGAKYFYDTITFVSGLNVSGDFVPSGYAAGHLSPKTNNLYDLGDSSHEWRDLRVDGTGRIDSLFVDENASISGNFNVSGTTYLSGDFIPANVATDFLPKTDNLYNLGSNSREFKDLWIDGTGRIDNLHVDENASISGSLNVSGEVYFSGDFIPINVATSLLPKTDDLYDLGSNSQEFRNLWIDGIGRIDDLHVDVNASVTGNLTVSGTTVVRGLSSSNVLTTGVISSTDSGIFRALFVTGTGIPATSTSAGDLGQILIGSGYLYACTGTNLWGRTHLTGWI